MAVRSTMTDLIAKVRKMIADPSGANQQFSDQDIQDQLDYYRSDVWYEPLRMAPAIVNAASTNNVPSMIFADYYSDFGYFESDVILQGNSTSTHAAWVVLTPVGMELMLDSAHFQFEATTLTQLFATGTFPGQYPPVWATGKSYDPYAASADLLEMWAATLTGKYDITVDGQSLHRSQLMQAKFTLAAQYRRKARPRIVQMVRRDVLPEMDSRSVPVLGGSGNGMSEVY